MPGETTDDAELRQLAKPSLALLWPYLEMYDEACRRGETGHGFALVDPNVVRTDPRAFLARLADLETGRDLPPRWVRTSHRWLLDGAGAVVGETRLRHRLTPHLEIEGGHVGYFIHPAYRGRGHGHAILRLALVELRAMGIGRVLVTCDADNARSRRVVAGNGGAFDRFTTSDRSGKQICRFWIDNG